MTNADFENALNKLQEDGIIYTTVDDNTFALTDWCLRIAGKQINLRFIDSRN